MSDTPALRALQRYALVHGDTDTYQTPMRPDTNGDWVRYNDVVQALMAPQSQPRCPEGWHHSKTYGYGPQRCVNCGYEWEFWPPRRVESARIER